MTQAYQYPNEQVEAPPKRRRRWPWIVGIVVAFLLGIGMGAVTEPDVEPEVVTETETVTEEVEVEVEPPDIEEQRAALGERESELDEREEALATLEASLEEREEDLASALEDQQAEAEEEETSASGDNFPGSGTFMVGDDVQPGTYQTEGGSLCYWERLSGLSGEFTDIIANGLPEGPSYVTIADGDMAFSSQGCGEWVRQ